jgi:hypothetical protein
MSEHHSITGEAVKEAARAVLNVRRAERDLSPITAEGYLGTGVYDRRRQQEQAAALAAAEPYMRRKWAEELLDEWSLGIGYSTLLNPKYGEHPATTFTRAVKYMIGRLEGAE